METINLLITLRNDNINSYLILLESLVHTNNIENIVLYIIGEETGLQKDVNNFLKRYRIRNMYFELPRYLLKGLSQSVSAVIHSPYVLPDNLSKVIYLNSNLILKDNIERLFEHDLGSFLMGACEDRWISHGVDAEELSRVGMSEIDVYFNTDVLVLNLQEIRKCSLRINDELYSYRLSTFINKYLSSQVKEIKDKRYNTQLMSYIWQERKAKYDIAVVINYGELEVWNCKKEDIDLNLYNLWWNYAKEQETYNVILNDLNKLERKKLFIAKCNFMMDYLRYALTKAVNSQVNFGQFEKINTLKQFDLWDSFYFANRKSIEYEKKYRKLVKGYKAVQIHRFVGGGAAMFFLTLICYKIMKQDDNVFHILIPGTMLANSPVYNPDFYVHNEYILKYFDNAYIPHKSERDFLRYIISKKYYHLDFSSFGKFSPIAYEKAGGDYTELERLRVIEFSEDEIEKGERFLQKNDIVGEFVCIAPRNNDYKKIYAKLISSNDYLSCRNGSIESYLRAVDVIQAAGYSLVQMGKVNKLSFPSEYGILNFSKIYDEFLDIYLFSRCEFVIGDASGLMKIADIFSKPTVQANFEVITTVKEVAGYFKEGKDIILPVKYWNEEKKRYLTLREQLELEVRYKDKRFEEEIICLGYQGVSNSTEELELAAREMLDIILGEREYTEEERHLQDVSRELVLQSAKKHDMSYPRCNFAVGFLELNPWYLT